MQQIRGAPHKEHNCRNNERADYRVVKTSLQKSEHASQPPRDTQEVIRPVIQKKISGIVKHEPDSGGMKPKRKIERTLRYALLQPFSTRPPELYQHQHRCHYIERYRGNGE